MPSANSRGHSSLMALCIGSCIVLGLEVQEIARLFKAFYDTATNAGNRESDYLIAGKHFADAVSKIGFDLLLSILLHKAAVPLKRKIITFRQTGSRARVHIPEEILPLPEPKKAPVPPEKVPIPEKAPPKTKGRKKSAKRKAAEKKATAKAKRKVAQAAKVNEILKRKADRKKKPTEEETAQVGEVWDNREVVVEAVENGHLPGKRGAPLGTERLSDVQMLELTKQHGVEFAQVYRKGPGPNGSGGQYTLYSGSATGAQLPSGPDVSLINHTHPAGTPHPSHVDRSYLLELEKNGSPQRSSVILIPGDPPGRIVFDKNTPLTKRGFLSIQKKQHHIDIRV